MRRTLRGAVPALVLVAALALSASAQADQYVALGDSYSSGTGTRSYTLNSGCQRGIYAYPYLVAQARPNTTLNFVACSGATTTDVMNNQISAVTSSTNIVTITIGGNDAGFSSVVTKCALPLVSCNGEITTAQNFIANTLPGRLNTVFNAIKTRAASGAKVVVLGYPRLFAGVDCNAGTFFSGDEMTKLNATADQLKNVEAARAAAYGFTFKDAIPAFTGHAVCAGTEWLNGLSNPVGDSYHPNTTGHSQGYAPLVRAVIG